MADITSGATPPVGGTWRKRDPNAPMAAPTLARPVASGAPAAGAATPPTNAAAQTNAMGAFGITPEQVDANAARTGVDAGGTGYVSGQVAPSGQALAALGAAGAAPHLTQSPAFDPNGPDSQGWRGTRGTPAPDGTATVTSGLTNGAPAPAPGGDDTATVTSALTAPGGNTGTTKGKSPLGPEASGIIGSIPVAGGIINGLTTPSVADLSPTKAAQSAAFGLSDNLNRERYDYRPGEAASMDLDTDVRRKQLEALGGLQAAANGAVPSAAELQLRREAGKNVAATLGQARALGARSAGGAARAGTMASADILARSSADAAQLRAQEQDQARTRLMAALGQTRGQDTDVSGANLKSQLEQNDLAQKQRLALLDAQLKALGIGTDAARGSVGASAENAKSENAFTGGLLDTAGSAIGLNSKKK